MTPRFSPKNKMFLALFSATVFVGSSFLPMAHASTNWADLLKPFMKDVVPQGVKLLQQYKDRMNNMNGGTNNPPPGWGDPDPVGEDPTPPPSWNEPDPVAEEPPYQPPTEPDPVVEEPGWSEPDPVAEEPAPSNPPQTADSSLVPPSTYRPPAVNSQGFSLDTSRRIITVYPSNNANAMLTNAVNYLINRSDKNNVWTFYFKPGNYYINRMVNMDRLQNVNFVGHKDSTQAAIIRKTASYNGEFMIYSRYSSNLKFNGLRFIGNTTFANNNDPVWPDQGLYFGSTRRVVVESCNFYNFGNAAVRVTTADQDPVKGVNSFDNKLWGNFFRNVYQVTTTSNSYDHGATANFVIQYNTFDNLVGALKIASRTAGAKNIQIIDNWIKSGGNHGIELNNISDTVVARNRIENIAIAAITAYTNPRAQQTFPWGDNVSIRDNQITNAGMGIRFAPTPYENGARVTPSYVSIENNTITNITDPYLPVINVTGGTVNHLRIMGNKLNRIASKRYFNVTSGSTNVSISNNYVDGNLYTATR